MSAAGRKFALDFNLREVQINAFKQSVIAWARDNGAVIDDSAYMCISAMFAGFDQWRAQVIEDLYGAAFENERLRAPDPLYLCARCGADFSKASGKHAAAGKESSSTEDK